MNLTRRTLWGAAFAALLGNGCGTSPPGAGLTNGEPLILGGPEKAAVRSDIPTPEITAGQDAAAAEAAASSPGGPGNNAGTGGRGNPANADAKQITPESASSPRANPPKIEASGANGAQGGTKPAENIKAGTPRSPQ